MKFNHSIRWKFLIPVTIVLVCLVFFQTIIQINAQQQLMDRELNERIKLLKQNLLQQGRIVSQNTTSQIIEEIAIFNLSGVFELVRRTVRETPDLDHAILMNKDRLVYLHTANPNLEQQIISSAEDLFAVQRTKITQREFQRNSKSYMEFIMPIRVSTEAWGVIRYVFSLENLNHEIYKSRINIVKQRNAVIANSVFLALFFIVIATSILSLLTDRLSKPIVNLTRSAKNIAEGKYSVPLNQYLRSEDEVGILAKAFVEMANYIQDHNRTLEDTIKQRSEQLKLAQIKVESSLRKEKELAESANAAKSQFLANMSHELRTPLNAIIGFSEILAKDLDMSEEQQKKMTIINTSGSHLLNLINDILDISKIESGKVELLQEEFELDKLLNQTAEIFTLRAESQRLKFEKEIEINIANSYMGDANKLRQILINLLGNALKFSGPEGFAMRACTRIDDSKRNFVWLTVEVEDSGCGILPSELETIFDPFEQSKKNRAESKGTGLGLAISQSFVQMMNGTLKVESQFGHGALFILQVPLRICKLTEPKINPVQKEDLFIQSSLPNKLRILVVEDSIENRLLLSNILAHAEVEIKEVENGEQAVELYKHWHPHFIWMDMRMPIMDGYDATRLIRASADSSDTRIIAVTANAVATEQDKIFACGCDDIVYKPYRAAEIFATMKKYLDIDYKK